MSVELNHTIVYCRDEQASAGFLASVLGLPPPSRFGPFTVVEVGNGVSLDFLEGEVHPQHYAFLVSEPEFDEIFGRLLAREQPYWADPGQQRAQQINTNDGGRGVYWQDPDGHILEILTVPYGGWPTHEA
jgi:catechol 2,3-dioxygenase-like lactoylglutathione lyase family enzyme